MRSEHTLYLVATPIGHRGDLSPRAVETLRGVSRIYAEDTRHSRPLMRHHGIATPLHALHEHNEASEASRIVEHLRARGSVALISDAGTPLISDPGFRTVRACHAAGLAVSPVPGPCAVSAALSVAGLPTDRFQFVGFPPARRAARRAWLAPLARVPHTLVLYESPHRIGDSLVDLVESFGGAREAAFARELTKRHETLLSGTLGALLERVRSDPDQRRGELVLVIAGSAWAARERRRATSEEGAAAPVSDVVAANGTADAAANGTASGEAEAAASGTADEAAPGALGGAASAGPSVGSDALALDRVLDVLIERLPPKEVARCAAELCGVPRRVAYARALELRGRRSGD